jgi:hypothetical protein
MSGKYKVGNSAVPHFVTFTAVAWIDVFSRDNTRSFSLAVLNTARRIKGWFYMPG